MDESAIEPIEAAGAAGHPARPMPAPKGSLALAVFLLALALAPTSASRIDAGRPGGDRIVLGELEIVVGSRKVSAGGFPNATMNPFRRMRVAEYSLRHRGEPVRIALGDGRRISTFNSLHVLRDAPVPTVLVPAGGFQLVSLHGGALRVQPLDIRNPQSQTLQWLDGEGGQPGNERHAGGLVRHAEHEIDLRGGRWLLLGRSRVLDVSTLRHSPVRPWIDSGSGLPMHGLNASVVPALVLSPRATRYVLLGSGRDDVADDGFDRALLVVDVSGGGSHGVGIPPGLRKDVDAGLVTGEWIRRHCRWRDVDGQERLEFRNNATAPRG